MNPTQQQFSLEARSFKSKFLSVLVLIMIGCSACHREEKQPQQSAGDPLTAAMQPTRPAGIEKAFVIIMSGKILSEQQFTEVASWYRALPAKDALSQLQTINQIDPKLAEAILLRREPGPGKPAPVEPSDAYVQYVTNTQSEELHQPADDAQLEKWVKAYADRLQVNAPNVVGKKKKTLKQLLQEVNSSRYDRPDVIPTAAFDFQDQQAYALQNAMWLADMASLAYEKDESKIKARLRGWGYANTDEHFHWFDRHDTDTQAFVIANDKHVILSFRGTTSFRDVLADANFPLVGEDGGGRVHSGFKKALDPVFLEIESAVRQELGDRKLFITGHSLGAALAQLAALRLQTKREADVPAINVTAVYTFGSPLVGDQPYAQRYDKALGERTYLHINHRDIVTRVPPHWVGFAYTVLGTRIIRKFINEKHELSELTWAQLNQADSSPSLADMAEQKRILLKKANEAIARLWGIRPAEAQVPSIGYDALFERGPLDDHGVHQYVFKLGCALIEGRKREALQ